MPRRRCNPTPPSSSHFLLEMVTGVAAKHRRKFLETRRDSVQTLTGAARVDWAIDQLCALPAHVWPGWSTRQRPNSVKRGAR